MTRLDAIRTAEPPAARRRAAHARGLGCVHDGGACQVRPAGYHDRSAGRGSAWDLIRAAQDGDLESFAVLYQRYRPRVLGYLIVRTRDQALAEDLTSETFLKALLNIHSVSDVGRDVSGWLMTIARNAANDVFRSARHRLEHLTSAFAEGELLTRSHEDDVLSRLEFERIRGCMDRLTADQRECIELRFVNQLTTAEVAYRMGRQANAVRALQRRALLRLSGLCATDAHSGGVIAEEGAVA